MKRMKWNTTILFIVLDILENNCDDIDIINEYSKFIMDLFDYIRRSEARKPAKRSL